MILVAGLLFATGVGAVVWTRMTRGDFCDPTSITLSVWTVSFGLYLLRMFPYGPMPAAAAATLGLGVGCLLGGIGLGRRLARGTTPRVPPTVGAHTWLTVFGILGIAGMCWYVAEVHRFAGWGGFGDAAHLRVGLAKHKIPSTFLFLEFFCVVTPLVAVALALTGHRLGRWCWLLAVVCVSGTLLSTDRTQLFTVVLAALFMYLYRYGRNLTVGRFLVAISVSGLVLVASFLAVGSWTGRTPETLGFVLTRPGGSPDNPASLERVVPLEPAGGTPGAQAPAGGAPGAFTKGSTLYMYATASYAAFAVWFPQPQPRTWGLHAVYPVARALQRLGVIRISLPAPIPRFSVVATRDGRKMFFNAYTLLFYPLRDFGIAGVIVYCLVVGLASGYVYERTRHARESPLHLLAIGQISLGLALSTFVNKFNNTASWYVLVLSVTPFIAPSLVSRLRQAFRR